jgi:hypothetical protein
LHFDLGAVGQGNVDAGEGEHVWVGHARVQRDHAGKSILVISRMTAGFRLDESSFTKRV